MDGTQERRGRKDGPGARREMLSDASGGAARVLCYGDSLTAGYWANGRRFHPYAGEAKRLLGVPIDHVGLCGWTTKQMVASLDNPNCRDVCGNMWKGLRVKLREHRYSHCVILAGTNDVGGREGGAEDIVRNIVKLASVAMQHGCKVFVMTIPEMRAEQQQAKMHAIRTRANQLLMQQGSHLNTIDLAPLVPYHRVHRAERDRIWEPDGLHLRPDGYDKMGRAVAARLTASQTPGAGKAPSRAPEDTGIVSDPSRAAQSPSKAPVAGRVYAPAAGRSPLAVLAANPSPSRSPPRAMGDPGHHQDADASCQRQSGMPAAGNAGDAEILQPAGTSTQPCLDGGAAAAAALTSPGKMYLRYNVRWRPAQQASARDADQSAGHAQRLAHGGSPGTPTRKRAMASDSPPFGAHVQVKADITANGNFSPERAHHRLKTAEGTPLSPPQAFAAVGADSDPRKLEPRVVSERVVSERIVSQRPVYERVVKRVDMIKCQPQVDVRAYAPAGQRHGVHELAQQPVRMPTRPVVLDGRHRQAGRVPDVGRPVLVGRA